MPSTSKSQQRLMGVAYAVKSGDMQLSDVDTNYKDKVKDLVDGMTLKQLKDFAETKHDGLPEVKEGISPASIGGMGPIQLPTDSEPGSGDVPRGTKPEDDEEDEKEEVKEMKNFIPTFEQFISEARDFNDPLLIKMRAAQMKAAKKNSEKGPAKKELSPAKAKKLAKLQDERAELLRDMEQEAEMEGGEVADRYGKMLNKIDKEIAKLTESIDEAKRGTIHKAVKAGDYPATIVVIENGKVVHQELVNTPEAVPASFNVLQKEYPKAKIHVEDRGGRTLFAEGIEVNESQWVAYISYPRGKKLVKTLKSHRAAVMWNNKNVDSILMQDNVEGVGIMSKEMWDNNEAEWAVESIEVNEGRSINKIKKDYDKVINDMAEMVTNWKAAKESGDAKAEASFLSRLKEMTAKKKSLMSELDDAVGLKDIDAEIE